MDTGPERNVDWEVLWFLPSLTPSQEDRYLEGDPGNGGVTAPYISSRIRWKGGARALLTSHHLRKEPSPTWTQHLHLPPAPETGQGEGEAACFALGLLHLCSPTGDSQIKDGFWVTYAQISHGEDYILQDKGSIAVLSNGVFCDDGNILYLCSPLVMVPLATWSY